MPTTEQLRSKLINKLKELFQLNQPDLDFGFYRIMHAKSEQVSTFIENDLLTVIQETFGQVDDDKKNQLKEAIDKEIQAAKDYGVPDPENSPKVLEARAKYEAIKDSASSEAEIYDHLYRFFERYYDDGDFISRRYYTRETPGKAAPFSIPYNGEEVKLHWANADQYYIKTTEYFANYTVNLSEAIRGLKENKKQSVEEIDLEDSSVPEGLKLHFRIIDATEGEHANVKASDTTKRYFLIHKDNPVELNDQNELVVNFEYRPTAEAKKQDILNKDALELVLKTLKEFEPRNTQKNTEKDSNVGFPGNSVLSVVRSPLPWDSVLSVVKLYLAVLSTPIPTEKDRDRILLTKYINQYTARNTMDYFIHKNLGAFLKRELDFYIKNEIMRLDDIENAEVPKVEDYLAKIKVLRKIAIKLIEFMAQLEDFQKKLWLKKKFVVETNYCITLDRVPEELYPQIIENNQQIDEWIKLYAIDEIEGDTTCPAFTNPLTLNFLKVNDKLLLDTRFFSEVFKAKLISSIQNFDDQCDGLLMHSENFQALNLLQERYREQVKCIYIDPPYNTGKDGFIYKDSYGSSSWCCMMNSLVNFTEQLATTDSLFFISNDDNENEKLKFIIGYNGLLFKTNLVWHTEGHTDNQFEIKITHEYITLCQRTKEADYGNIVDPNTRQESNLWKNLAENSITKNGPQNPFTEITLPEGFPVCAENGIIEENRPSPDFCNELGSRPFYPRELIKKHSVTFPLKYNSASYENFKLIQKLRVSSGWANLNKLKRFIKDGCKPFFDVDGMMSFYLSERGTVYYKKEKDSSRNIVSVLRNFTTTEKMKYELEDMDLIFSYPKPKDLIEYILRIGNSQINLDYFAGSGTTGHAVINLNREDNGNRQYILVEMGDYFDTVLKPRICKVVYSKEWKDGKPKNRDTGVSHCFKYLRLESYEDTLNNLVLQSEPIRDKTIADIASLQEDYLLHYMLDVETGGSQSLLNIDAFNDPTSYVLKVKKPGSDEYIEKAVDLIETFNYLIGLRLVHLGIPQTLTAAFTRLPDPDLPQDQDTKLVIVGDFKQVADGKWWIRKVEGWVPKNPYSPNDGLKEKVLIVWRKLTGNLEEDNLILDSWFQKNRISTLDWEFDTIYVNGSNNLPNLQKDGDTWKVRLIEEEFMKRMWEQG